MGDTRKRRKTKILRRVKCDVCASREREEGRLQKLKPDFSKLKRIKTIKGYERWWATYNVGGVARRDPVLSQPGAYIRLMPAKLVVKQIRTHGTGSDDLVTALSRSLAQSWTGQAEIERLLRVVLAVEKRRWEREER